MAAVQTQVKLPAQVVEDLTALENREGVLSKKGRWILVGAVLTGIATVATYAVGYWYAPSTSLSVVHVPAELLALFADDSGFSNAAGLPIELANSMVSVWTGPAPKVLAGVAILVGGGLAAIKGDFKLMIAPMLLVFPLFILSSVFGDNAQASRESDREAFVNLATAASYAGMQNMMKDKVPVPLQQYVLAQAILVQAESDGKKLDQAALSGLAGNVRGVDEAVSGGLSASVSGKSLYALEKVALGSAKSKPAQNYYAEATATSELAEKAGRFFAATTVTSLLAGVGLLLIGRRMRARIARIRPLLGLSGGPASRRSVNSGTPVKEPPEATVATTQTIRPVSEHVGLNWIPPHERPQHNNVVLNEVAKDDGIGCTPVALVMDTAEVGGGGEVTSCSDTSFVTGD